MAKRAGKEDRVTPDFRTTPGHLLRRALQSHTELWSVAVGGDLTPQQYAVLVAVELNPGLDQRTLGDIASLDKSTAADLVSRLVKRGDLERRRDPSDGRRDVLDLTEAGRKRMNAVTPAVRRLNDGLLGALAPDEREMFLSLLERVAYRT